MLYALPPQRIKVLLILDIGEYPVPEWHQRRVVWESGFACSEQGLEPLGDLRVHTVGTEHLSELFGRRRATDNSQPPEERRVQIDRRSVCGVVCGEDREVLGDGNRPPPVDGKEGSVPVFQIGDKLADYSGEVCPCQLLDEENVLVVRIVEGACVPLQKDSGEDLHSFLVDPHPFDEFLIGERLMELNLPDEQGFAREPLCGDRRDERLASAGYALEGDNRFLSITLERVHDLGDLRLRCDAVIGHLKSSGMAAQSEM